MGEPRFVQTALFEHRFWLQVLGDHSRFILNALSPKEMLEISRAQYFILNFDQLLENARDTIRDQELFALTQAATMLAQEIREFKLHLLRRHLAGEIAINLPPTFINHMVNEVEEYLRILSFLNMGQIPPIGHPLHHHLIWLVDAAGHAGALNDMLDPVEADLKKKTYQYKKKFNDLYLKAIELAGYLRTNLQDFPALARFNHQVDLEIKLFSAFLHELEEMELDAETLGTLSPLLPDHMAREECYYLMKLALSSNTSTPECDPTKPRVEA